MSDEFDKFEDREEEYPVKMTGSFGRFQTAGSYPIDFLLASFTGHDAVKELTLARKIMPDRLDFDMLMQRDIDEKRVSDKIQPYLEPREDDKLKQVIFFPPLLAAVVPVKEGRMQRYYSNDTFEKNDDICTRIWEGQFKIDYRLSDSADAYDLHIESSNGQEVVAINPNISRIHLRRPKGSKPGIELVVIDGQHRLRAIEMLAEKRSSALNNLIVPVCLLYPANSVEISERENPSVSEVFRKLFIDVNNTTELVGGHFNILLNDSRIPSLICRQFCSMTVENRGAEHLAAIEWNTKKKKDSTQIRKNRSLTSIGVLDQALTESLKRRSGVYLYLLGINEHPELSESPPAWESFTLEQREALEKVICERVIPLLDKIFFQSKEFSKCFDIYESELKKLKNRKGHDVTARQVYNQIVDYQPFDNNDAEALEKKVEETIKDLRSRNVAGILRYSIFHRALIDAWVRLLALGEQHAISPDSITNAFVFLLDECLSDKGVKFSSGMSFNLYSIYGLGGAISTNVNTKKALSDIIIAHLGGKDCLEGFLDIINLQEENRQKLKEELIAIAITGASQFLRHYENSRRSNFEKSYTVDNSIPVEKRDELARLEAERDRDVLSVKEKKLARDDISKDFDNEVTRLVEEEVTKNYAELQRTLCYDGEILSYQPFYEEDEEEAEGVDE